MLANLAFPAGNRRVTSRLERLRSKQASMRAFIQCSLVLFLFPTGAFSAESPANPIIIAPPFSKTAVVGSNVTLSVSVSGFPAPAYQWRLNGTNIAGAVLPTLAFPNVALNQSGDYDVVITNDLGSVTSRLARLTVIAPTRRWTGNGGSLSWTNGENWSPNAAPAGEDDIFIGGGVGTITNLPNDLTLRNLLCHRGLAITGSMTATGSVDITGNLYLAPGSDVTASGPDARFVGEGPILADSANLYAEEGGMLQLPGLIHYSGGAGHGSSSLEAGGVGSVLDLSFVKQMEGVSGDETNNVVVYEGGRVDLSGLTNVPYGRLDFKAFDPESAIDLSTLKTFVGPGSLIAKGGGTILADHLTSLTGVDMYMYPGGTMSLSNLAYYSGGSDYGPFFLQALGTGAVLYLPALKQMEGAMVDTGEYVYVQAKNGGVVNLTGLTNVAYGLIKFKAYDATSFIGLPALNTCTGPGEFYAERGGTILANQLADLNGMSLLVYPRSTIALSNLTRISGGLEFGDISVLASGLGSVLHLSRVMEMEGPGNIQADNGGIIYAEQLTNLLGLGVSVYTDSSVVLPRLAHCTSGVLARKDTYLRAQGNGSVLDLSSVRGLEAAIWGDPALLIQANGGLVNLSGLTNIPNGKIQFYASNSSSTIDLSSLRSFNGPGRFDMQGGARITVPQLTNLVGVSLFAKFGSSLQFPSLSHFSGGSNMGDVYVEASGTGSVLDLSSVRQMEGWSDNFLYVLADEGGAVNLGGLTNIADGWLYVYVDASGQNSVVNLAALQLFNARGCIAQEDGGHVSRNGNTQYRDVCQPLPLAPFILVQPQSTAVFAGSAATFHVSVDSDPATPLHYQWYFNETNLLANATNATLIISNVTYERRGRYHVIAWNEIDEVESDEATLRVAQPLTLAVQGRGTIAQVPDTNRYDLGQTVLLTPTPLNTNYTFLRWSDSNTNKPRLITITESNNFYTAVFTNVMPLDIRVLPQWEQTFGGNGSDFATVVKQTKDGGYVIGGYSDSSTNGSHASANSGGTDWWFLTLDANGNKTLDKSFGGTNAEMLRDIVETSDGFVLGGSAYFGTGPAKTNAGYGGYDYWLLKTDTSGHVLWERVFGGDQDDNLYSLVQTSDGGFLLGGNSYSTAGTGNRIASKAGGVYDAWLVRTDSNGNKLWDIAVRSPNSTIAKISFLTDGFMLTGFSDLNSRGDFDFWAAKIDDNGNSQWQTIFGGSGSETLLGPGMVSTPDGGGVIAGRSSSDDNGDKNSRNFGPTATTTDIWATKFDADGNLDAQASFGTINSDAGYAIESNGDGGFVLVGSYGSTGGNRTSSGYGNDDAVVIKLDANLVRQYESSFGGSSVDYFSDVRATRDGGFIAAGASASPRGSGTRRTPSYGGYDFWVVKFFELEVKRGVPVVLVNGLFSTLNLFAVPVTNSISVTLTSAFTNGLLFYTLDGSPPDFGSNPYTNGVPFIVTNSTIVRAIAYADEEASDLQEAYPVTISVVPICSLTDTTPGGGSVTFNPPGGIYLSNTVVTIAATPSNGWTFIRWEGAVMSTNNPVLLTMSATQAVHAVFGTMVSNNVVSGGGSVALSPPQGPYAYGSAARLIGVPASSKYFSRWFSLSGPTNNPYDFVVLSNTPTVNAFFSNIPTSTPTNFTLTVLLSGPGTVMRSPAPNLYLSNSPVRLTAMPDQGFVFINWNGAFSGTSTQIDVIINSNAVVTANFGPTGPPSNRPPSVILQAPLNGALFTTPANITLSASASDEDGTVAHVDFYSGGALLASNTSAPYQFTWSNVPPATYSLSARATDNAGGSRSSDVSVVTVSNSSPVVFITQPTNGATVDAPTNFPLIAYASDGDGITEVRFYHGTNLIGVSTNGLSGYYSLVWTNPQPGEHVLTAEAHDRLGAIGFSLFAVSITVLPPGFTGYGFHFTQLDYSTPESAGSITVFVQREPSGAADVDFATIDGSASSSRPDYFTQGGPLHFTNEDEIVSITIPIVDNSDADGQRRFYVQLTLPGEVAPFTSATVTILDDDTHDNASYLGTRPPTTVTPNSRLQIFTDPTNGGWRLPWERAWRGSGGTMTGLVGGQYSIEYKPVAGFITPVEATNMSIAVPENSTAIRSVSYTPSGNAATGALTVVIEPPELTNATWSLAGEQGSYASGVTTNVTPGNYVVIGSHVDGWEDASPVSVPAVEGEERIVTLRYTLDDPGQENPNVESPRVLHTHLQIQNLVNSERFPLAWNGQFNSDIGKGSGVVVKDRVVLTAAHVVWDESRGQVAQNLRWFFQRHAGEFEPKPTSPAGVLLLSNYVGVRSNYLANGGTEGVSTPESRPLDVAVVYFGQSAGRSGYGGYLLSETTSNEWLLSTRKKMLVGYPTSGPNIQPGKIHETSQDNFSFLGGTGGVYHTFVVRGLPGNSGGPLYVQHPIQVTNLVFFPAGIYLGSSDDRSYVRGIDSNVVRLINLAAAFAVTEEGTNELDPSILNITFTTNGSTTLNRHFYVTILPPEVTNNGARWSVWDAVRNVFVRSNQVAFDVPANVVLTNNYRVDFAAATGYVAPQSISLTITGAYDVRITANYLRAPIFLTQPKSLRLFSTESARFSASVTGLPPLSLQWQRNSVALSGATSSVLQLSNVGPTDAGVYTLLVTNVAASATSAPASLTILTTLPRLDVGRAFGVNLSAPTGRTYQVESTSRPNSGWTNWRGPVLPLDALMNVAPTNIFTNSTEQYFRVRVTP